MKNRLKGGLKKGNRNLYEDETCLRTGQKIGVGVYFSNHIEVCEQGYATCTKIGEKQFRIVFQCRVNPKTLKQAKKQSKILNMRGNPDWDNDYFVINDSCDIRPYRILLKEI